MRPQTDFQDHYPKLDTRLIPHRFFRTAVVDPLEFAVLNFKQRAARDLQLLTVMRLATISFLLATLLLSLTAAADPGARDIVDTQCTPATFTFHQKPLTANICVHRQTESKSRDILYFFHGLGEDERNWIKKPNYKTVRADWRDLGFAAPVVINVSFGSLWLLAPLGSKSASGLYEVFLNQVMPYVEHQLVPDFSGHRYLIGMSMGGFNAAQIALRNPALFKKVALLCPATVSFPIYPKSQSLADHVAFHRELEKYWWRNHANPFLMEAPMYLARRYFTAAEWEREGPLKVAERTLNSNFPPLFISAVHHDEYGLEESDRALATLALNRHVNTEWDLVRGAHCDFNAHQLASFLAD